METGDIILVHNISIQDPFYDEDDEDDEDEDDNYGSAMEVVFDDHVFFVDCAIECNLDDAVINDRVDNGLTVDTIAARFAQEQESHRWHFRKLYFLTAVVFMEGLECDFCRV